MASSERYREVGVSGLKVVGGRVRDEWLKKLQGKRGLEFYREIADNDDTIGACYFLIESFLKGVKWSTTPFSSDPLHQYQADYAESLRHDMSHSWSDLIAEILTNLTYGFELNEIVWKRRVGPDEELPEFRSAYSDRLMGIRKLAPRAQETIDRWHFDEDGGVKGVYQVPPLTGKTVYIPISKLLNFKTTSRRNNPEGRSALRNCVIAYIRKRDISEYEAIGINRDLAGLARIRVPGPVLQDNPPPALEGERERFEEILEDLHNDELAGLLLSSERDPKTGEYLYDFDLVTSGGTARFDTSGIITRYDNKLAQNFLADFILMGHAQVGSYSLSSSKTNVFSVALGGWNNGVAEVLNCHLLPRAFRLNGWPTNELPKYVPGDLEDEDVEALANAITSLTGVRQLTPGDPDTENVLRQKLGLPELPVSDLTGRPDAGEEPDVEGALREHLGDGR